MRAKKKRRRREENNLCGPAENVVRESALGGGKFLEGDDEASDMEIRRISHSKG